MKAEQKRKKTPWQQWIGYIFSILVGVACGVVLRQYMDTVIGSEAPLWKNLVLLPVEIIGICIGIFMQIIIHESGHLVFGLLSGYRFSSFRIMSFMWVKENGKTKFRRLTLAGTSGQCLMSPPDMVDGKLPVMLCNLGGSLMNMITGSLFLVLYFVTASSHLLSGMFLLFAISGVLLAVTNGVPMRLGTINNDGYNAFALRQNREALRSFWIQLKTNHEVTKGVRFKDMPDEWFTVPDDEAMKNSMIAATGVFACNRLVDAHKFSEAEELMAHLLEIDSGMVGLNRHLMICDRIYIELITENRHTVLTEMLTKEQKKFMKSMKKFPSVLRTEYVYALLGEGDLVKAQKLKAQFEKYAKTYPYPSEVQSERELMEIAEQSQKSQHNHLHNNPNCAIL